MPNLTKQSLTTVHGESSPGTWLFLHGVFRSHISALSGILCAQSISGVLQVLMPFALANIVKELIAGQKTTSPDWPVLFLYAASFIIFVLADIACTRRVSQGQIVLGPKLQQSVLSSLFAHLVQHSHRFISNNPSGALSNQLTSASTAVTEGLWIFITELWLALVVVATAVFILLFINVPLALIILLWSAAFFAVAIYFSNQRYPQRQILARARVILAGALSDAVSNILCAKLFAQEPYEIARFKTALDAEDKENFSYAIAAEQSRVVFYFLATTFKIVSLILAAVLLLNSGERGVVYFILIAFLANTIIQHTAAAAYKLIYLNLAIARVETAVSALLVPLEITGPPDGEQDREHNAVLTGAIEFRNVAFSYHDGRAVFNDLSVTIPAGQKVALVGASGAGKTSFTNLLLRLYDANSGAVLLDGIDIKALPLDRLYRNIAVIPQDPVLFHRSIRENIRYGRPDASEEAVRDAAVQAACDQFIAALPQQYDALVGEKGVKLSGGQRQRIAIARAVLKDAPIVVLDEASSALDSITESEIQRTLQISMRNKTVIVVAHRLSTIKDLDRILVFDEGKIVEDGSHVALMARQGLYFNLWNGRLVSAETDSQKQSDHD